VTELAGRIAVVTGASRGLGQDVAAELEALGARVARVSRTADWPCDVSSVTEVASLAERIEATLGTPQILVNAAGMFGPLEPLSRTDAERWIEAISVDLIGPYLMCRAFVPGMLASGWGRIINVSSASSLHPPGALATAYGTAKVALNQLTRHLAAELRGTGVTANVIHPGDIKTDMWADIRDQAAALGVDGESALQWVNWVDETGGDPPAKAVDLVLSILGSEDNGRFLWIDDGLQEPVASWDES
jgi:NAD(P)-dependent dehydrogenase (short-subunit alcohol dehydrogenase family)